MTRLILLLALAAAPLMAAASPREELFQLIQARLSLMQQVAAYKWRRHLPIEDKQREKVVLDKAATDALQVGLRLQSSRAFFQAQIDAAKEIERYWFAKFDSGMKPPRSADLDKVIRPKLINLGRGITESLGHLQDPVTIAWQPAFMKAVQVEGLSDATRLDLFTALTQVAHYPNRLQQILETKELRVGTTGDYPPFSMASDTGYRGIDIDMARDLARALGVKLTIVRTSWPTLIRDLKAGLFDIAMSGVSRNTQRQKSGFFSEPYYRGGKTPIARCADASTYKSLADIDRPGVRVIVNPGGTNAAFAKTHLSKARVIVFDDNTKIFDQLIAGKADVMVTDAIEVRLQTKNHKQLCATMPGKTLTYQDKAYLMPPDIHLKAYVDTWLELRKADGTVPRIFASHMN